jgi:hypothetical protein
MKRPPFVTVLFLALSAAFFLVPDFRQGLVWPLAWPLRGLVRVTGICIGGT